MRLRAIAAWTARGLAWLGPSLVLVALGYRQRWVTEDAFITFRVVANLLAGDGPVYNLGERVEAYTHPLWLAMLAALQGLGVDLARGSPFLGLALAVTGLLAAQAASARLARRLDGDDRASRLVPLGAVVFVALGVVWDFATSGLETGLIFGWIGVSYALVARAALADAASGARRRAAGIAAVIVGLGSLVRPDLAVMSVVFLGALGALPGPRRLLEMARLSALALALPAAYQVFRMGYFAATVPNTALAKEAGEAYWGQGLLYVRDFVGTYWLWIPGILLLVWGVREARRARRAPVARLLLAAPVVAAALHAVWVVRVGGDFMHGRFLLPSLFAALAPLAMVRVPAQRRSLEALVIATVVAWSVVCGLALRWSATGKQPEVIGIVDERLFYFEAHGRPRGIVTRWTEDGLDLRRRADTEARTLEWDGHAVLLAPIVGPRITSVSASGNIGLLGYAAGPRVHIVDRGGLADPIAGRLRLEARGRPGHEKRLPTAWIVARFAAAEGAPDVRAEDVRAARAALGCGRLAELLHAITAPLTLDRFQRNVVTSWTLSRLRIPSDPERARAELCEGR